MLANESCIGPENGSLTPSTADKSTNQLDMLDGDNTGVQGSGHSDHSNSSDIVHDRTDSCFELTNHSTDHSGQVLCPVDLTDQSENQDGQTTCLKTDHLGDHHILCPGDHADQSYDCNGQTFCHIDQTDHSADQDGQNVCSTDQSDNPSDHNGQTCVDSTKHSSEKLGRVDHTDLYADCDGHNLCTADQTDNFHDHDGQTCRGDETGQSSDHSGQRLCQTDRVIMLTKLTSLPSLKPADDICDQTDNYADCTGQKLGRAGPTDHIGHSADHSSQRPCHTDQVVMLTRLTTPPVTIVKPADDSNHCVKWWLQ